MNTQKHWVLLLHRDGSLKVWRDYGDIAWGSPDYTILGYYEGTYRDALRYANNIYFEGNE